MKVAIFWVQLKKSVRFTNRYSYELYRRPPESAYAEAVSAEISTHSGEGAHQAA